MNRDFSSQQQQSQQAASSGPTSASAASTSTTTVASRTLSRRNRRRSRSQRGLVTSSTFNAQLPHLNAGVPPNASSLLVRNPRLAHKLRQMSLPLSPLVQLTTGAVHPDFPSTVLHFWLLTNDQLESLASFYHQARPSPWSGQYPCPVRWRSDAPLEEKRRRMGRFIGLRGCEPSSGPGSPRFSAALLASKSDEELMREIRLAAMASDEEAMRRKTFPGPFHR
ncbi:hypothetical protein VHEMI01843 [[Torrubiella] hemipterigena]|uniref:Beta-xylosidase n=1 Tax=[Torrubiella] hemipterigena TaxID=1531966 RepID=A0A0A1T8Q0_9HYPO|nr:hypothetical protein VHEMI01843 [[Torrubiella] hemipterigena]